MLPDTTLWFWPVVMCRATRQRGVPLAPGLPYVLAYLLTEVKGSEVSDIHHRDTEALARDISLFQTRFFCFDLGAS